MTTLLFREDAYATSCDARVAAVNERGGIILDQTVFYATAGGKDPSGLERALRKAESLLS